MSTFAIKLSEEQLRELEEFKRTQPVDAPPVLLERYRHSLALSRLVELSRGAKVIIDFELVGEKRRFAVQKASQRSFNFSELPGNNLIQFNGKQATKQPNPILLRLVLAPEMAEDVIANLDHYYKEVWHKKHGPFVAKSIFYAQNARVILSHYGKVIRDTLELYLKRS